MKTIQLTCCLALVFAVGCGATDDHLLFNKATLAYGQVFSAKIPENVQAARGTNDAVIARFFADEHAELAQRLRALLELHPDASRSDIRAVSRLIKNQQAQATLYREIAVSGTRDIENTNSQGQLRELDEEMRNILKLHPTPLTEVMNK